MAARDIRLRLLIEAVDQTGRKLEEIKQSVDGVASSLAAASSKGAEAGTQIADGIGKAGTNLESARSQADQLRDTLTKVGEVGKNLAVVGASITAAMALPVKNAVQFEFAMARVAAVTDDASDNMDLLVSKAQELARETPYKITQVAEGMKVLGQAGLNSSQILGAIRPVLDLATAGVLSMAQAADITIAAMTGMGLTVQDTGHIVDVFAKIANATTADVADLGEAFKYAAAVAGAVGVPLETLAGALGVLHDAARHACPYRQSWPCALHRAERRALRRLSTSWA